MLVSQAYPNGFRVAASVSKVSNIQSCILAQIKILLEYEKKNGLNKAQPVAEL